MTRPPTCKSTARPNCGPGTLAGCGASRLQAGQLGPQFAFAYNSFALFAGRLWMERSTFSEKGSCDNNNYLIDICAQVCYNSSMATKPPYRDRRTHVSIRLSPAEDKQLGEICAWYCAGRSHSIRLAIAATAEHIARVRLTGAASVVDAERLLARSEASEVP